MKRKVSHRVGYFSQFLLINALLVLIIMAILASVAFSLVRRQVSDQYIRESEKTFGVLYSELESRYDSFLAVIYSLYGAETIENILNTLDPEHERELLLDPQKRQQLFNILDESASVDSSISLILLYARGSGTRYVYDKHGRTFTVVDSEFPFFPELSTKREAQVTIGSRTVRLENRIETCFALGGNLGMRNLSDPPVYIAVGFNTNVFTESIQSVRSELPIRYTMRMATGDILFDSQAGRQRVGEHANETTSEFFDESRNMSYSSAIDNRVLRSNSLKAFSLIAAGLSVVTLLFFLIYGVTIHTTKHRMDELLQAMNKLGKSDLSTRIPVRGTSDEFDRIALHFNKMSRELDEYIKKAYVFELKKKNAELGELQSKISPHFLSNTIDSLRRMIAQDRLDEADEMMVMLARFYRLMIMKKSFVTISEELSTVRLYLDMMSIRYSMSFSYHIHYSKRLSGVGIIRNILQPLVENYFKHGYDPERSDNHLELVCKRKAEGVSILITDNGRGCEELALHHVRSSLSTRDDEQTDHYGLSSVYQRLRMMYGTSSTIELSSKEGSCFTVALRFPARSVAELDESISSS